MRIINFSNVGEGNVCLIAGGGKVYTDIAARFCHSNNSLDDILASPYDKNIVKNILDSGHLAATEFDYFIFGIEGYSRATEVQLVRKRLASYLISSGRDNRNGKREFSFINPNTSSGSWDITEFYGCTKIGSDRVYLPKLKKYLCDVLPDDDKYNNVIVSLDGIEILELLENWYNTGVALGFNEEDLRYWKPQGTEFKAIIGMNAHALIDWSGIRCCLNAQKEIRDLCNKMIKLAKEAAPDLMSTAGPRCKQLGYCPENKRQNPKCNTITKDEALEILSKAQKNKKETIFNESLGATKTTRSEKM